MATGPVPADVCVVWATRYTKRELILAGLAGALAVAMVVLLGFVVFRGPTHRSPPGTQAAGVHPTTASAARSPSMSPPPVLRTEYSVRGRWAGGFNSELVITNLGSDPVEGWTVRMRLPSDVKVSSVWAADLSQAAGAVTLRSQPWNTYLAPGAAVHLGFEATGTPAPPISCTVNGAPC
jgi:cellulose binding protein with CBM2 domain